MHKVRFSSTHSAVRTTVAFHPVRPSYRRTLFRLQPVSGRLIARHDTCVWSNGGDIGMGTRWEMETPSLLATCTPPREIPKEERRLGVCTARPLLFPLFCCHHLSIFFEALNLGFALARCYFLSVYAKVPQSECSSCNGATARSRLRRTKSHHSCLK